MQEAMFLMMD